MGLGELLRQLGVPVGELRREVGRGRGRALVQPVDDLVEQDVAGPAVLNGGGGVPVPLGLVVELVEQHGDVTPGQSSNRLLDDCVLYPGVRQGAHVEEIAAR
jgi:hypothetical protein